MPFKRMAEILRANSDIMVSDVIDLINIPSVTGNFTENKKALEFILCRAEKLGFSTEMLLGGRIGIVECGKFGETVGILTHADVVPPGDAGKWSSPPFSGCIKNDCIFGRGAVDDKGPLIASLYAMYAVKSAAEKLNKRVRMIIGTSEEGIWDDMEQYAAKYPLPDYGFTPDGEFPITNIEKGYADVVLSVSCKNNKSNAFKVIDLSGGNSVNTTPDYAKILLEGDLIKFEGCLHHYKKLSGVDTGIEYSVDNGKIVVSAQGRSVHSSTPEKCENAIVRLFQFIKSLPVSCDGAAALAEFVSCCFGSEVYGETLGLPVQGQWYNGEFVHRTTAVPTLLTCSHGNIQLNINFRTRLGTTKEMIREIFETWAKKYGFTFSIEGYLDPIYISREEPFIKLLAKSYADVTGSTELFNLAYGTSYAKAMPRHVSFGPVFPGEADYSHQADERILISSLMKASEIYAHALYCMVTAVQPLI